MRRRLVQLVRRRLVQLVRRRLVQLVRRRLIMRGRRLIVSGRRSTPSPGEAERLILDYRFDESVFIRAEGEHPMLIPVRMEVEQGLREWFITCAWRAADEIVDMPSMSVDWVWHSFILHTAQYVHFCEVVYGGYLHHHPVTVTDGIKVPLTPSPGVFARSRIARDNPGAIFPLFALDQVMGVHHGMSEAEQARTCFVDRIAPVLVNAR